MADPKTDMAEDLRADLEKQISDLKREMARMGKSLAARAGDAASRASDALDDAGDAANDALEETRGRARRLGRHVSHQAHAAAHQMRENPGTTAVVLSSVAVLGLVAGLILGNAVGGGNRPSSRWL